MIFLDLSNLLFEYRNFILQKLDIAFAYWGCRSHCHEPIHCCIIVLIFPKLSFHVKRLVWLLNRLSDVDLMKLLTVLMQAERVTRISKVNWNMRYNWALKTSSDIGVGKAPTILTWICTTLALCSHRQNWIASCHQFLTRRRWSHSFILLGRQILSNAFALLKERFSFAQGSSVDFAPDMRLLLVILLHWCVHYNFWLLALLL